MKRDDDDEPDVIYHAKLPEPKKQMVRRKCRECGNTTTGYNLDTDQKPRRCRAFRTGHRGECGGEMVVIFREDTK